MQPDTLRNDRSGTFIVIEGTDGSGKGTQTELLRDRLTQAGYDVATFDFPQYDLPSSYFVKQYLNGEYGTADEVGPYTASLFYALDRYQAAPKIRQALKQGKIVVCNRFTGSSMAHQGTKFRSAEERRGYFIWLDNLEFEMLKVPRPDISFVLRVPAETAQNLVDQKAQRNYTDKKRDIHEADLNHLKRALEVYDDLTQLFPKDFQRIDCVRGDKLLDVNTIQNMLWEKISPLLPPPPQLEMPIKDTTPAAEATLPAPNISEAAPATASGDSTHIPAGHYLVLKNASNLLAELLDEARPQYIAQPLPGASRGQEGADGYYYIPAAFDDATRQQYCGTLNRIFELHDNMLRQLTDYAANATSANTPSREAAQATATSALQAVLPVAASTDMVILASAQALEYLLPQLLEHDLAEVREAGSAMLAEVRKALPDFLKNAAAEKHASKLGEFARQYLTENHAAAAGSLVRLDQISPRNELELVASVLYEHSNMPLDDLRVEVDNWPYNRKLDVLEAFLDEDSAAERELQNARYTWDALADYASFRTIQRYSQASSLTRQQLTPRHGYDVPQLIEDAGLADQFQDCFDLSLQLHSVLQQNGYSSEAQYAVLLGHKLRWKATHDASTMRRLHKLTAGASDGPTCQLIRQMSDKIAEIHPIIAEAIARS